MMVNTHPGAVCVGGAIVCCQKTEMLFLNENGAVFKTLCQYCAAVCSQSDALGMLEESLFMSEPVL